MNIMIIKIVIDIFNLIVLSSAILICIAVLILIFLRIHPITSNVPILLTCNTYIALILVNVMMLIGHAYIFYGDLHPSVSVNDEHCPLRAYFCFIGFTAMNCSCLLQSIFRLNRVVFYRRKILQSSSLFMIVIIIQWILSCITPLFNYLTGGDEYVPFEYICQIAFTNSLQYFIGLLLMYIIPLLGVIAIYLYLIRHLRQTNPMQQRRILNERDMLVLKRIVVCVLTISTIGVPSVIIGFIYMVSHYLIPFSYQIQGLSLVLGLFFVTVCFIFITPQLQAIFKNNQTRVLPMTTGRINRNDTTQSIQQQRQENF